MDSHPDRLPVQQYGMLVLMRLCQQDQETYEVIVSEGGLVALLNVVTMATRGWWWSSSFGSNDGSGNHHGSSAPALSGYTDEESYREDYAGSRRQPKQHRRRRHVGLREHFTDRADDNTGDEDTWVCANILPIVLTTMDAYPLDAAIQAYGCDVLGRLAHGEESARIELIETTVGSIPKQQLQENNDKGNHSRLWKKATTKEGSGGGALSLSSSSTTDYKTS